MPPVIGIPATLSYYTFFPFWHAFWRGIGFEVATSRPTNRAVLDAGVTDAVSDACVPIKLMHGHVSDLKDRTDYIFCPRMVSGDGRSTFCPKFLGLPDMVRFSRSDLPPIIDTRFHVVPRRPSAYLFCRQLGDQFNVAAARVFRAYTAATRAHRNYRKLLHLGHLPHAAIDLVTGGTGQPLVAKTARCRFAVVGFPYIVHDRYVSIDLLTTLEDMGVAAHTIEMLPERIMLRQRSKLPHDYFWYYSNRVAWASLHYLERPEIDGLIHVTAFGCGPDSMLNRVIDLEARRLNRPFLTVAVDEHTGEAGIATRLEAFVDMLMHKKEWSHRSW